MFRELIQNGRKNWPLMRSARFVRDGLKKALEKTKLSANRKMYGLVEPASNGNSEKMG